jgi:hypothetical protein
MQRAWSEGQRLVDHLRRAHVFHGEDCLWCKLHPPARPADVPDERWLHPSPPMLHDSEHARRVQRRWLHVQCFRHRTAANQWDFLGVGLRSKYAFNTDVQLSPYTTPWSEDTWPRALKWLTQEDAAMMKLLTHCGPDVPFLPPDHTEWSTGRNGLWMVLDYPAVRTARNNAPRACTLEYRFSPAGQPVLVRRPGANTDPVETVNGGPLVCLSLGQLTPYTLSSGNADTTVLPIMWSSLLHLLLVQVNGHLNIHELLHHLQRLLAPWGLTPVCASDRLLDLEDSVFGFAAVPSDAATVEPTCTPAPARGKASPESEAIPRPAGGSPGSAKNGTCAPPAGRPCS